MSRSICPKFYISICIFVVGNVCFGADNTDKGILYFEKHVRPLLSERCLKCHSKGSKSIGGNLLLDHKAGWMQGGDLGMAIVPGNPDESLLIKAVRQTSDEVEMPPDGKLSAHEISVLTHWIKIGAPDPRQAEGSVARTYTIDIEEGRKFWAFQPPKQNDLRIPAVRKQTWPLNQLDSFVLAELEKHGLHPVQPADKRTLIRRATFDLTGLPPTPDEVDAFLTDDSPRAYAKLIDRLLDSQHYGERWGRYWLDVARYADSNGRDENVAHGNAWRYRDYVIAAFNHDKPFDQFILEQLAGDLLPETADERIRNERAIATGFLSLGPKVLAEVDETKMEMDIVDEQVETVGRAFLGLTLGCARCHDHKFDPIRTKDYYALAGIFKSTKTMEHFTKIARWNEVSVATEADRKLREECEQLVALQKKQIDEFLRTAKERLQKTLGSKGEVPKDAEKQFDEETKKKLAEMRVELKKLEEAVPELPTAMGVVDYEKATDLNVHIRGSHLTQGDLVPRGFPVVLVSKNSNSTAPEESQSGRLQLAHWLAADDHPLVARVMVNRLWRWHFGRGLVESTDNFGQLGERPSNQALLDWLAVQFVQEGWSIKTMHRLIMLSSTYQMSSDFDSANAAIDPDNRHHWRADMRRLEAEAIRDSILAVSGMLDKKMGGSLLHVKNREFIFNHTSKDETKYDSPVRSVYLPVVRNHLYDVFQLFDYSDAGVMNSNRPSTTVAPQALFMMNSDLVNLATNAFADRVLNGNCESDDERLDLAYNLALGRPPTDSERQRNSQYLELFSNQTQEHQEGKASASQTVWRLFCQTLFASNEFIYIR